ncbi:MAG: hypothetical protein ACKKL6_00340 [Candidatus Komeilibacteria bacterium]
MRDPELHLGVPDWHHHHSHKVTVDEDRKDYLRLRGSAVVVEIFLNPQTISAAYKWLVKWKVVQVHQIQEVTGQRCFSDDDLKSAFGLSTTSGEHGEWMISRFGATVAEQAKYIRWRDYLNIPGPGIGHDGDPNVSILLSDEIKWAVRNLLEI